MTQTTTPNQPANVSAVPALELRDWFAGQALCGMIPAPKQAGVPMLNKEGMAKAAYEFADAMLLARKAKPA